MAYHITFRKNENFSPLSVNNVMFAISSTPQSDYKRNTQIETHCKIRVVMKNITDKYDSIQ